MAETHDARELVEAQAAERDGEFFPLNELPNDVLVSVFAAAEDPTWVRHTFPLVCRAWNELYLTKDASPLHETLEVDFKKEVERAAAAAAADSESDSDSESQDSESESESGESEWEEVEDDDDDDDEQYEDEDDEEEDDGRLVVRASRVIAWAQARAGSVRKLILLEHDRSREACRAFGAADFRRLLAVVGPSLTDVKIDHLTSWLLCDERFWECLRESVVPFGRLRSFFLIVRYSSFRGSELEVLGQQLAGSLEELLVEEMSFTCDDYGLQGFPRSVIALEKLRRLVLIGHPIRTIPAGISSMKRLEELDLRCCKLSSPLSKELGELPGLTKLLLCGNRNLGATLPADEAFPAELGGMKSLRELDLSMCGLRTVPAFLGGLESLEVLDLSDDGGLQIDAPLDFLVERCPLLRTVRLKKVNMFPLAVRVPWTRGSLAHIKALEAKLRAKNPIAEVVYK